jgi:hypothetical protein
MTTIQISPLETLQDFRRESVQTLKTYAMSRFPIHRKQMLNLCSKLMMGLC